MKQLTKLFLCISFVCFIALKSMYVSKVRKPVTIPKTRTGQLPRTQPWYRRYTSSTKSPYVTTPTMPIEQPFTTSTYSAYWPSFVNSIKRFFGISVDKDAQIHDMFTALTSLGHDLTLHGETDRLLVQFDQFKRQWQHIIAERYQGKTLIDQLLMFLIKTDQSGTFELQNINYIDTLSAFITQLKHMNVPLTDYGKKLAFFIDQKINALLQGNISDQERYRLQDLKRVLKTVQPETEL